MQCVLIVIIYVVIIMIIFLKRHLIWLYVLYNNPYLYKFVSFFKQNFAAQYDGSKGPDPGPGPMVSAKSSTWKSQNNEP